MSQTLNPQIAVSIIFSIIPMYAQYNPNNHKFVVGPCTGKDSALLCETASAFHLCSSTSKGWNDTMALGAGSMGAHGCRRDPGSRWPC